MEILNIVAKGDQLAVHLLMSGTHQRPFMGIAPTGKTFAVEQMRLTRFRNSQMTDSCAVFDWLGWRQQLGAMSQPQPAPVHERPQSGGGSAPRSSPTRRPSRCRR